MAVCAYLVYLTCASVLEFQTVSWLFPFISTVLGAGDSNFGALHNESFMRSPEHNRSHKLVNTLPDKVQLYCASVRPMAWMH